MKLSEVCEDEKGKAWGDNQMKRKDMKRIKYDFNRGEKEGLLSA